MSCSPELQNYLKISELLINAKSVLQKAFAKEWKDNFGQEWLDSSISVPPSNDFVQFIKKIANLHQSRREIIEIGNSSDWDVQMFFRYSIQCRSAGASTFRM